MRTVEGVLLILAIVADVLAMSVMLPSCLIYLGNYIYWFIHGGRHFDKTKVEFIPLLPVILMFTLGLIGRLSQFLDFALKEFVPMEGPLHSAVDKVLKGIAWIALTLSVIKIFVALPLVNPYSGQEVTTLVFWTIVFLNNIMGADFSTTRQESPRIKRRGQTNTLNPNAALLTPPNQSWDPIDAFIAILFIVTDTMSNYLVPSLTIFIKNFWLDKVNWTPASEAQKSTNLWLAHGLGISIFASWGSILFILNRAFFHLAPPGGIHRPTIVQILCTLNGLWFGVTFYKMSLDLPLTSDFLDSEGVMTSLGYWGLTSLFLLSKDVAYDEEIQADFIYSIRSMFPPRRV